MVGCLAAKLPDNEISDRLSMNMHTLHSHLGRIFTLLAGGAIAGRRSKGYRLVGGGRLTIS